MTESDAIDRALARARSELTPSNLDRSRVLGGLETRFPVLSVGRERAGFERAEAGARPGFWHAVRATGRGGISLGAGLVLSGFAVGYIAKTHAPEARESRERPETVVAALPVPLGLQGGSVEASAARTPAAEDGGARTPSHDGTALTPKRSSRRRAAAATGSSQLGSALERELLGLQRAERALRSGNATLALTLLDELDVEHPRALLGEERAATRVMASCQAQANAATAAAAQRFLGAHPQSVYGKRVRTLCRLDTDEGKPPETLTDGILRDTDER